MAGTKGNGTKKNQTQNKNSEKDSQNDIASTSAVEGGSSQGAGAQADQSVSQKLDNLLAVVTALSERVSDQDDRIRRQEERVSAQDISVVPSASSSPKVSRNEPPKQPDVATKPDQLPSFEVLKSDSRIQAEVARINASRLPRSFKS